MADILWITGRRMASDLASSTERGLFMALKMKGHNVTMHYPNENQSNKNDIDGLHPSLNDSKIKGMRSRAASLSASKLIRNIDIENPPYLLVDWRLVPWIKNELSTYPNSWFLVDRGPPAYRGLLSKIQWIYWSKSWRIANNFASGGLVVSEEHGRLVKSRSGASIPLCPISGSVAASSIKPRPRIEIPESVEIVYVGRLDQNRGILDIQKIVDWGIESNTKLSIHIAGDGDSSSILRADSRITHHGILDHQKVHELLLKCDIGLLPMPPGIVWSTASPLKLAEYAAAGLAVVGTDHLGHRLEESSGWINLSDAEDWWKNGIMRFSDMTLDGWNNVHFSAQSAAKTLTFERSAEKLVQFIKSV